ncbi:beta-ketoacyl-ACP reductase [Oceanobacillus arenosus]|uniref:Beta-ketoacyl-ACP reductase n=1 Tax=Oceanobacillus arenosus TaxID=1229153 RepID=A0A3D8PHV3_9BACI|nr:3-oxoacyl-ACP reductase FabG [Oceanobacillus arenosus]RDW15222.1 beta-ketoacyl-ACP reductase [Oceanobacillus arenosus]
MLLQDKVAIVTGASSGIGKEIALTFAKEGAKVVANYATNDIGANQVIEEIESFGGRAALYKGDISKEENAKEMIDFTVDKYNQIDILVNNAGIIQDSFLVNMSLDTWNNVIQTNLTGPFLCSKFAIRKMMRHRKGKIINISSISGLLGNKGQANYASAKAGLIGLTRTIAQEYSSKGISANAVAPGIITTEMTKDIPGNHSFKLESILKGEPGKVSDIAGTVLFLASGLSNFINGEVIRVDGGHRW